MVHNGIIENATALRTMLSERGHRFVSETDTEVIAHLIEQFYTGTLEDAVAQALRELEGAYGIAVVSQKEPDTIVAARQGSPLLIGLGEGENYVASDPSAVLAHTRSVIYLDEGEMAVIRPGGYQLKDRHAMPLSKEVSQIDWDLATIERGGFSHFMLKEICEQPESVRNVLRGRILEEEGSARLAGINMTDEELSKINRIVITACGTSWHAGLVGEYMLEELARLPVEVEYASEFRYRNPIVDERTLVIVISQSGETADNPGGAARGQAPRRADSRHHQHRGLDHRARGGRRPLSPRRARDRRRQHQAFTAQITALAMFHAAPGAGCAPLSILQGREIVKALRRLPEQIEKVLAKKVEIEALAERYVRAMNVLYLGRGYNFPVALEGGAEAEGDLLHPRRGLSRGRDEARADRADRRADAGGLRGSQGQRPRQDRLEHRGGPGRGGRPGDRHRHRGRYHDHAAGGPRHRDSRDDGLPDPGPDVHSRSSCWPTTSRCGGAATWTSQGTWPRASRVE